LWETPYSSEKVKLFLYKIKQHAMKMYKIGDVQVAKTSLTAALDAVGGQINALATLPLTPAKRLQDQLNRGRMCIRTSVGMVDKRKTSLSWQSFRPQPTHYIDQASSAPCYSQCWKVLILYALNSAYDVKYFTTNV